MERNKNHGIAWIELSPEPCCDLDYLRSFLNHCGCISAGTRRGLSEYEIVLLRLYLVSGLEVTIFSLMPPLLGLFGITPSLVWRGSSLVFALVMIWRGIYFRRRQVRFERRRSIDLLFAFYSVAILGLLINALGIFIEPNVAPYALAATWLLVNAIIGFIMALERFLHPPGKDQG